MPFCSGEQDSDLLMSLSSDFAHEPSLHRDVTEDVLVPVDPPTPFNDSFEFKMVKTLRVLVS